jgi:NAD(P)-dependent dehydrogenase (short-subunit alcohol dehydrogenase family)
LASDGFRVALLARNAEDLAELKIEIERRGGVGVGHPVDLAEASQATAAVEKVVGAWQRVDVLVNAAGTDAPGSVEETTAEDWDRVLGVNLRAPFLLSRSVFPLMRRAGGGTIINVSSVAGLRGWADAAAYCSSKFALTGLTQALAAEGRPHGIRACVLYPGAMATSWGMWEPEERRTGDGEREAKQEGEALPADQVAELIAWIVSAPGNLVLNQVTVTPLLEQGWP